MGLPGVVQVRLLLICILLPSIQDPGTQRFRFLCLFVIQIISIKRVDENTLYFQKLADLSDDLDRRERTA